MVQEPVRRTSFSGPALVRLLASLNNAAGISGPTQSLSDRLSQWLGWSDAIALAAALGGALPAMPGAEAVKDEDKEYTRVRKALSDAITGVNTPAPARHPARRPTLAQQGPAATAVVEFSTYRQRYISLQQTMEARCTELRTRLRAILAGRSPDMARLAAVDAVMEQALNEREFSVLARVPVLLEAHFKRLQQAAQQQSVEEAVPGQAPASPAGAWLNVFHEDMQSVLFAELDIRLQPAKGLLAALACQP